MGSYKYIEEPFFVPRLKFVGYIPLIYGGGSRLYQVQGSCVPLPITIEKFTDNYKAYSVLKSEKR